jgi:hypothetical protein
MNALINNSGAFDSLHVQRPVNVVRLYSKLECVNKFKRKNLSRIYQVVTCGGTDRHDEDKRANFFAISRCELAENCFVRRSA